MNANANLRVPLYKFFSMALMKSISGIRGTIGGKPGENLTPLDVVKFSAAYATMLEEKTGHKSIVIGRDARISGEMVRTLVVQTLIGMGWEVIDLGLSTTPTVEMAVKANKARGGIILTASHNPKQWNALKLLNAQGEFISAEDGRRVLSLAEAEDFHFASVDALGKVTEAGEIALQQHVDACVQYPLTDKAAIAAAGFRVVVDAINSSGAVAMPALLHALGVKDVVVLNENMHGDFAHNPEPLPEHLQQLSRAVVEQGADLGIAVDPDVDRLCFVNEDGTLFGEEYTLVAVADYVLSQRKGNTVSNLSSTRALADITQKHGGAYYASAVGEVNVVEKMKAVQAVIGGEGNGGIIVPDLHYGRDALIGTALFLSHLARSGKTMSALRSSYPDYHMSKKKLDLAPGTPVADLLQSIAQRYTALQPNLEDGVRISWPEGWVHLRASNTEPIIRVYAEAGTPAAADALADKIMQELSHL